MTLSSMVVSRDWQEVSVLECILGSLQINVTVEREPQRALSLIGKSKIDALILDCDLNGTSQFLRELPGLDKEPKPLPLMLMGASGYVQDLDETGALFAFQKPISVEQALRTLSAARNLIVDGRLRYQPAGIALSVGVKLKGEQACHAQLVNLSQGGMQIHTAAAISGPGSLQIVLHLPGSKGGLNLQAEVVWKDEQGNTGLRFVRMARPQQRALQLWLAQQFLAN
jgi:DNA-binding response OmpR family regulator